MTKLHEIAQGWFNFINGSPEIKQMMDSRLRICDECPHKRVLNKLGQAVVKKIHEDGSIYFCGVCSCPLAGKTAGTDAVCPIGKWGKYSPNQSYY